MFEKRLSKITHVFNKTIKELDALISDADKNINKNNDLIQNLQSEVEGIERSRRDAETIKKNIQSLIAK